MKASVDHIHIYRIYPDRIRSAFLTGVSIQPIKWFEPLLCFGQNGGGDALFNKADIVPNLMAIQVYKEDRQPANKTKKRNNYKS